MDNNNLSFTQRFIAYLVTAALVYFGGSMLLALLTGRMVTLSTWNGLLICVGIALLVSLWHSASESKDE